MADPLRSARIKLKRANLHAGIAKREAARFIDEHPSPPIHVKQKAELQQAEIGGLLDMEIVFGPGPSFPDLPDSFSARFGDAIQNYRCALDHVAWQLVKHGATPQPPNENLVSFPIYTKRVDFKANLATRLPGVNQSSGGPCDFIEKRHRYQGGKAGNDVLLRLRKLSNDDKHRSLHAMVTALSRANHEVTFKHCRHTTYSNPSEPPHIEPGAVITHFTILITGPYAEVEVQPDLAAYIALEGWANAMDILTDTRKEVTEIINAPEILGAL